MSARVLVAGIGNVFMGDDGFGVAVAQRLAREPLPDGVAVADIGIRALHLAYALLDAPDLLVVIDAVTRGEPPGTVYLIEPDLPAVAREIPDAHGVSLQVVGALLHSLGGKMPPVRLIGCEPAFIGERMGLSAAVEDALPVAISMIRRAIAESKHESQPIQDPAT